MKIITKLLFAILSVLGFSSCQGGGLTMYGQPTAYFRLTGTVVDKETKVPIDGILLKINTVEYRMYQDYLNISSAHGSFYSDIQLGGSDVTLRVIWQDIDAIENGLYKKDSLDIAVKGSDYKGGDNAWYEGSQTKEVIIEIEKEKL